MLTEQLEVIDIFIPASNKNEKNNSFCIEEYIKNTTENYPIISGHEYLSQNEEYIFNDLAYHRIKYGKYSY